MAELLGSLPAILFKTQRQHRTRVALAETAGEECENEEGDQPEEFLHG
jgi:hypothetical protein